MPELTGSFTSRNHSHATGPPYVGENNSLTGLIFSGPDQKRSFSTQYEEISQWLRRGGQLSCLLVDLDYFKQINDRHGHQAGDLVLQEVARTLSKELRASDVLARYGGEEFVLLLPATGSERAAEIAERLRTAIASLALTSGRGMSLRVTASFGLASLVGGQRATLQDPGLWLLRQADQALYTAKAHGRNCVRVAGDSGVGATAARPWGRSASREH